MLFPSSYALLSSSFSSLMIAVLAVSVAACGTEAAPIAAPGSPNGSGTGSAATTDAGSANGGREMGACSFVFVDGATRIAWTGKARARMNGSGNLLVRCTGRAAAATEDSEIELGFGNATFDGPRTYLADDFSSDGSLSFDRTAGSSYSSHSKGGACSLVLSEALVDARGSSVPKGSPITASFTCTALPSTDQVSTLAIEEGSLSAIVE